MASSASAAAELHGRVTAARPALRPWLGDAGPVAVQWGLGDRHDHGRSVARLSGPDGAVFYKPRPLDMEEGFGRFVSWLNGQAHGLLDLRAAPVLARGDHGFAPEVRSVPCGDAEAAGRLGVRFGMLLAVADVLAAIDLHAENLVVEGEHPVPIDVETLLHPPGPFETADADAVGLPRTELLPRPLPTSGAARYVVCGLGALPAEPAVAVVAGTWPTTVADAAVSCGLAWPSFCEHVQHGFESMSRFLHAERRAVWADDGPVVAAFAGRRGRFVPRATSVYAALSGRAGVASRLQPRRPELTELCAAEREALARGDIPRFSVSATDPVVVGEGRRLAGLVAAPGLAFARTRALARTDADVDQTVAWVAACLRSSRPWPRS